MSKETDEYYMNLALSLAMKGVGHVNPNPLVGAIIVNEGKIIGSGYHEKYGSLHAERNALKNCSASCKNSVLYVTLEPCCHQGKQPPCCNAIIDAGISRVVIGSSDPNPLVQGKGVEMLRNHGIDVTEGILKKECDEINKIFFHFITTKIPYVTMKYAMTFDGKISYAPGKKCRISCEKSQRRVHKMRNRYASVMVGAGTVIADNPKLTCRIKGGRNPIRIVCDSNLRIPLDSYVVKTALSAERKDDSARTIIATCCTDKDKQRPFIDAGCEIVEMKRDKNLKVDIPMLMKKLGEMNIDSVLLEGGSELNGAAIRSGIVNHICCFCAPKIFGGSVSSKYADKISTGNSLNKIIVPTPVGGQSLLSPSDAVRLCNTNVSMCGSDVLIEADVEKRRCFSTSDFGRGSSCSQE